MMLRKWEFKGFWKFHRCFRGRFLSDDCFLVMVDMKGASCWVNK